jgi:hypothetical protein
MQNAPVSRGFFCFAVIARSEATTQSILSLRGEMDCFASLAMTVERDAAYRSKAAFRRLSCGTSGLPIGARSVTGAWIEVSSRRTRD